MQNLSLKPANDNDPRWPRGLSRKLAAGYSGVSLPIWDKLVADGSMPGPKRVYGRTIWDRQAVDRAFDLLDGGTATSADAEDIVEFGA